jgi:hypothetical protein
VGNEKIYEEQYEEYGEWKTKGTVFLVRLELLIKNLICGEECRIYDLSHSEGLNTLDILAKLSGQLRMW